MKTIKELSIEMGLTKEALYKKINYQLKNELQTCVVKLDGVIHLTEEGINIIYASLSQERREALERVIDTRSNEPPLLPPYLLEYIELLKNQLNSKDQQIEAQNQQITQLIEQMGDGQILLKNEQHKNLLFLEITPPQPRPKTKLNVWQRIVSTLNLTKNGS